jgi:hypothetical protein
MKKIVSMLAMLLLTVGIVGAATTVDTTWSGSGLFQTHFIAGDDATSDFWTGGSVISGEYHAIDSDNNPYSYGVDSVEAKLKAHTEDGFIEYSFTRDDSYESMYGLAGQESYTVVDTYGTGDLAWRSSSNYAALVNSNYGWQANGQIQATGDHYIYHSFDNGYDEGAEITVDADANTIITDMCESSWGSSYTFGKGCGCYTNANVNIVGEGVFDLKAFADNQIVTDNGITTDGYLNIHSEFGSGFHYNNFALIGN